MKFSEFEFSNVSLLGAGIQQFGRQIQILRDISCLEPAPKVANPEARPKYEETIRF